MSQEFITQLYRYYKCLQNGALANYFGMTKDPTSCYMFVMRYYEKGNLYSYLDESMGILFWKDIVDMLWSISTGLNVIHESDADPSNRPTASQLYKRLGKWVSDLPSQFDNTEIPFVNLEKLNLKSSSRHEGAIYFSRPLDFISTKY
ncbi:unnamed protein product [Rhizophagus irregularis]|nr:unnamed protein product [Rhizophagus irregularis]